MSKKIILRTNFFKSKRVEFLKNNKIIKNQKFIF